MVFILGLLLVGFAAFAYFFMVIKRKITRRNYLRAIKDADERVFNEEYKIALDILLPLLELELLYEDDDVVLDKIFHVYRKCGVPDFNLEEVKNKYSELVKYQKKRTDEISEKKYDEDDSAIDELMVVESYVQQQFQDEIKPLFGVLGNRCQDLPIIENI